MINFINIALTVFFSQNLLLVLTFAFGAEPKTFLRPSHALTTGFCLTLFLMILAPLSRLLDGLMAQYSVSYFSLVVYSLVATMGVYYLSEIFRKLFPDVWKWTEASMRALPTNAGVLGVILICAQEQYTPLEALAFAFFGGIGVTVALLSLVGVRQNQEHRQTPECIRGLPLLFITAGLLSLSLVGFYGLHIS